jgi:hypothetical protein
LIRRRHVIYVEGYDPQGAEGYYGLFARSWKRFLTVWPLTARLGALELDSPDFAHWDIETSGPNWQVFTRYDFLRQEHIIRANMAQPLRRQVPRALGWAFDYLVSGAIFRVLRASWEFGLALIHFQMLLIWWLALAGGGGWLAAWAATHYLQWPGLAAFLVGVAVAVALFVALKPLADRWYVLQFNGCWPHLCAFARGEPTCFDAPIEACAQRIVAAARAHDADEIVVIGHSAGGALAPGVVARALELDPELGCRGVPLVLLTLGSAAPVVALHPKAVKLRAVLARLAAEPSILWLDAQARRDVLNFWKFDPIEGLGIPVGRARYNPRVWEVRISAMLPEDVYRRLRFNFFRLHFQFIMANDQRAPYDYFMLLCGPLSIAAWTKSPKAAVAAFDADASLAEGDTTGPAVARVLEGSDQKRRTR